MFGDRYPRKLESTLTDAAKLLDGQSQERASDQRQGEFFQSIVWTQAGTLCYSQLSSGVTSPRGISRTRYWS
jgi:hypothetical protein